MDFQMPEGQVIAIVNHPNNVESSQPDFGFDHQFRNCRSACSALYNGFYHLTTVQRDDVHMKAIAFSIALLEFIPCGGTEEVEGEIDSEEFGANVVLQVGVAAIALPHWDQRSAITHRTQAAGRSPLK